MKKSYLLIIPVVVYLFSIFINNLHGPYWLQTNQDPEYSYLFNALNIHEGYAIHHYDHPGTPVQIVGSWMIAANTNKNAVSELIENPEKFLFKFNKWLVIINISAILLTGLLVFRYSQNLVLSIIFQISWLIVPIAVRQGFTRVAPEPMLFAVSMVFSALLFTKLSLEQKQNRQKKKKASKKKQPNSNPEKQLLFVDYSLAFLSGLGLAVKITFFPLLIIPIILSGKIKKQISLLLVSIASFFIFTAKASVVYDKFFKWIGALFMGTEHYGKGAQTIINPSVFLENSWSIIVNNPLFIAVFIFSSVFLIRWKLQKVNFDLTSKYIIAINLAIFVGIVMVAKHYREHYLLPVLLLFPIQLFFIHTSEKFQQIKWLSPKLKLIAATIILIAGIAEIGYKLNDRHKTDATFSKLSAFTDSALQDYAKIYYLPASSKPYALKFANIWSGDHYSKILQQKYPDSYFYYPQKQAIYTWGAGITFQQLNNKYQGKMFFQGKTFSEIIPAPPLPLTLTAKNDFESVYVLNLKK